ncbi:unnamed protein product [Cutaneotrichosporon oleaginosum]
MPDKEPASSSARNLRGSVPTLKDHFGVPRTPRAPRHPPSLRLRPLPSFHAHNRVSLALTLATNAELFNYSAMCSPAVLLSSPLLHTFICRCPAPTGVQLSSMQ